MKNSLSLSEAKKLLDRRQISSEELTRDCLDSIRKLNKSLNAYITLNTNAIGDARKKDAKSNKKGKLNGIPLAIKDNFLTKGLRTTASSKVLDDYIPEYNATVVNKLLDEGAVILGKTNMDAWAHGSSTERSDYGPTRNPWNFKHVPGGSSGGSAAATVADMCIASIGSETAGSVRGPSAWCGCVGLKPTYGRVSRYGVIAMGSSLDCPGPITKTVYDSAYILEILAGRDPYDATTSDNLPTKYTSFLGKEIKGMKIAIARQYLLPEMKSEVKDFIIKAGKVLEDLGANVEYADTLNPEYAVADYTVIQRSEVSSNLARYDGIRYGNNQSFFGEEAKRRIILGTFALSEGYSDEYYKKAQKVRTLYINDFNKLFTKYDLIIGPTLPGPAPKIGVTKDAAMFGEMADMLAEPSSMAGLPGISVPCGFIDGLPIGLDIIGSQYSEAKLLQVAFAYEQSTSWHIKKPKIYKLINEKN